MHGTGGTGGQFTGRGFAGELFLPGQPLDITKYYIVMPDDIGHGKSSKPSDGLRAKFPRYGYQDMLTAEHALLTEGLGVNHLRLVMGTSMGGMHTWLWGERWPDVHGRADAARERARRRSPGRNRVWRRVVIDAIRNDPEWQGGNYTKQPQSARTAAQMLWLVEQQPDPPPAPLADAGADRQGDRRLRRELAAHRRRQRPALRARSLVRLRPGPGSREDQARRSSPINSADDLVNPPEIGLLEKEITRVPKGRAIMIPLSDKTAGHGTHTLAAVWKQYLVELLQQQPPSRA